MSFRGKVSEAFMKLGLKTAQSRRKKVEVEFEYLQKRVRLLEQLLEEKNDSLERVKSSFLKNIYHEIRTPLNSIIGFSDLIEINNIKGPLKDEYIKHIRESSRDFLGKLDNIIDASILEAGMLRIQNEQCRLVELMNEIHAYFSLHKHITEKRIAFLLSLPDSLKKSEILCDVLRLTQVLTHLIGNAFKYTEKGIVEFGCEVIGKEIRFFIKDTGIGGLEEKSDTLFKNFSKTNDPNDPDEGLGLGLSLSKSILEQMGGKIWFKSRKGQGTTFYFTIPYLPVYVTEKKEKPAEKRELLLNGRFYKRSVSI